MAMPSPARCFLLAAALLSTTLTASADEASWTQPQKPFHIYGDTWFVGSKGLSAILITSPKGHILIDGPMAKNAGMIEANIRALGFRLRDVRVIVNSHAHHDHAGAIAALAKDSGARVVAGIAGVRELEAGGNDPDDPLYGDIPLYPAVAHVQGMRDGGVVRVGPLAVTLHATPGHTPGNVSLTWRACEGTRCLSMAYVGSLTAVARPGFRFTDHPRLVADFPHSFATAAALPCDILLTPHTDASGFIGKVAARDRGTRPDPLVDAGACRRFAAEAGRDFDAVLAKERAAH
jgi:metallo-beta-lactamase class B